MERAILHCDLNNFYSSVELVKHPELQGKPVVVAGDITKRHGIILAKSYEAKAYGITTGDALYEAHEKCPDLVAVDAHFEDYLYYSQRVKAIYERYSDQIESYGIDECWIDVTGSLSYFGCDAKTLADRIRKQVFEELGLTISVGVSWNKVFAKLGSDYQKPDATTVISKDNYQQLVWELPAQDLLFVGRSSAEKLYRQGIYTIGDIARSEASLMKQLLGKVGEMLWAFANGMDVSKVALSDYMREIKSVGNSITTVRDIYTEEEAKLVFYVLCESVAERLKRQGLEGRTISIYLRSWDLHSFTRQVTLDDPTDICEEIMEQVMILLHRHYAFKEPLRSIGLQVAQLKPKQRPVQLALMDDHKKRNRSRTIDQVMAAVRERYGHASIKRCSMLLERELTAFDPLHEHIIHPEIFIR